MKTHYNNAHQQILLTPWKLAAVFLFVSFLGYSQSLSDFATAANGDGIKAIPYSSMRSEAGTLQGEKDRAFSACSGYKARTMHDSKANSVRIKNEVTEDLEEAKKKLAADDGKSSSVTATLKAKVATLEKELAGLVTEIKAMDVKIDEGLERWQALLDKRMEINELFADVKYKLGQSKSSPHNHITKPSSSDKAAMEKYEKDVEILEGYIEDIIVIIDRGTSEHVAPITEAENAVEWLKKAQDLN